jgi:hypothetical protein
MTDFVKLRSRKENVIHYAIYKMATFLLMGHGRTTTYDAEVVADYAIVLYRILRTPDSDTELKSDQHLARLSEEYSTNFNPLPPKESE